MKKAMVRNKDAYKAMCINSTVESKNRYEGMKNKTAKVVSRAIREKAGGMLTELRIVRMECLDW